MKIMIAEIKTQCKDETIKLRISARKIRTREPRMEKSRRKEMS